MKERFKADTLDAAVQVLKYADSQGIGRKSVQIEERGGSVTAEVDFAEIDKATREQLHHYTESQGIQWSATRS